MSDHATQGHRYDLCRQEVLALESGAIPMVAVIDRTRPWPLTHQFRVDAKHLAPMPMRYFHGEVPK